MLEHQDNPVIVDAAQTRVPAGDLIEALASLDARKARQDYERVGTVTLAEGIQGCGIEVTPEELQAEVQTIKEADSMREKVKHQQRRLRLILFSELWSAALGTLAVAGLYQTLFNKDWQKSYAARAAQQQQTHQQENFQKNLLQSLGPNPKYQVVAVFDSNRSGTDSPTYPLYRLPDGCNIHGYWGRDDRNSDEIFMERLQSFSEGGFKFQPMNASLYRDNITVYYGGRAYWRGWVLTQQVPQMLQGKSFMFFSASAGNGEYRQPQYHLQDIRQVTLAVEDIKASHGLEGSTPTYDQVTFPDGQHVHLDEYAWEAF